jgi:hypothetical protein
LDNQLYKEEEEEEWYKVEGIDSIDGRREKSVWSTCDDIG